MPSNIQAAPNSGPSVGLLFAYPFRVFFLSLAIWAVIIVPLWLGVLLVPLQLPLALTPLRWHQHEMLFGLLNAAIAGFLLTAVCAWTQTTAMAGRRLLALWLVWVAGRVAMLAGGALPYGMAALPDLLFLPLVMLDAGVRIWRARQRRQLLVLVVLALIWLMQLGFHSQPGWLPAASFTNGALVAAMALMLVIGGRITPAFSTNWLRSQGRTTALPRSWPALDRACILSVVLVLVLILLPASIAYDHSTALAIAAFAGIAATLAAARLWGWRGWRTAGEPLLWMLHLSLWWIPIALALLAGSQLGWWRPTVWQHAVGAGAMGGLVLGVISRVALGHTGRPLQLPRSMLVAFLAVHLAAVARVATALEIAPWQRGLEFSAFCWILAFGLFLWCYTVILCSPRVDGKPG